MFGRGRGDGWEPCVDHAHRYIHSAGRLTGRDVQIPFSFACSTCAHALLVGAHAHMHSWYGLMRTCILGRPSCAHAFLGPCTRVHGCTQARTQARARAHACTLAHMLDELPTRRPSWRGSIKTGLKASGPILSRGGVKCLGVGARDPGPRVRGKGVEGWEPCEVADKFRLP